MNKCISQAGGGSLEAASLQKLEEKTKGCMENSGISCARGVFFYQKASPFQLDWSKGKLRGQVRVKATGEEDEEARKQTHIKFHAKVAAQA